MKRGGWIPRRTPLQQTRLRKVNKERRDRLREAQFGVQADRCRTLPCSVPGCRQGPPCDPHHVPSRGAGGLDADTIPLCRFHHTLGSASFHKLGERSFNELHGINCREIAAALS